MTPDQQRKKDKQEALFAASTVSIIATCAFVLWQNSQGKQTPFWQQVLMATAIFLPYYTLSRTFQNRDNTSSLNNLPQVEPKKDSPSQADSQEETKKLINPNSMFANTITCRKNTDNSLQISTHDSARTPF